MIRGDSGAPAQVVSDYEEQVWLLQQQYPDRVLKYVVSWQLNESVDITILLNAIRRLIEAVPDLNALYNLSEDGALIKDTAREWHDCVEIVSADSSAAREEYILACQAAAWHPERDAPFNALFTLGNGQVVLSLILHEILAPAANMQEIMRYLRRAYSGDAGDALALKRPQLPPFCESFASPVPAMRRPQGTRPILHCGTDHNDFNHTLAMRWRTVIGIRETVGHGDRHTALAGIILNFARFIAQISGQHNQLLCLLLAGGPRNLALDTAGADARLVAAIVSTLCSPAEPDDDVSPDAAMPWIRIRVLPDAEPQPWPGEPLLLPTREPCPDIELALEASPTEQMTLTLTLGQAMYSSLGEYLLDKFVAFLDGDECVAVATGMLPNDAGVNPVAEIILSEFRTALNVPEMSLTDDFFDFGGHSLLATRVMGRLLSNHSLEVHFGDFFSYPSAAALAPHAEPVAKSDAAVELPAGQDNDIAPLARAQSSLWQAYKAYDFGTIFNLPFALDLLDTVDEGLLEGALTDVIERHPSLRTRFFEKNGDAYQQVVDMAQLADYKWFWASSESQEGRLEDEAAYRFDLARELPLRVRVLSNPATGRQVLSLLVHHMAIDEWSLNIMMAALSRAYAARVAGAAPVWETPALSFHAFALRQQAEGVNPQHLAFWHQMLRDATPGLALAEPNGDTAASPSSAGWLDYRPQPAIVRGIYALARQNNASPFIIMYTAIALALHRLGDLRDIAIGTSASGRTDQTTHETVGYFTTMVAHRVTFDPEQSVTSLIANIRDTINNSMPYADVPLDIVQQSLGISPEEGLLFDVYIQIHASNALNGTLDAGSGRAVRYRQIDPDKTESMFGLQFEIMEDVIEGEKNVRLVITWRRGRYPEPLVKRIGAAIDSILAVMTTPALLNTALSQVAL